MDTYTFSFDAETLTRIPAEKKAQVDYITDYYKKSIKFYPEDQGLQFGLPHPYIVPDCDFFTEFFYWDTYYMFIGLLNYENSKEFLKGLLQNFAYEIKRFGRIPNNNAYYSLSRSQSPYFAIAIQNFLEKYPDDIKETWIQECVEMAIHEYTNLWTANNLRNARYKTESGLSRYWDIHSDLDIFAEYESGWDTTSRFGGKCLSINPIDLNSQLYMYESFFSWYFTQTNASEKAAEWQQTMENRKKRINDLCWDEKEGVFFDYNFVDKKTTGFYSPASFFPLFAGFATQDQATRMVPILLEKLEMEGGISITEKVDEKASKVNQWDYPNGWPPLMWISYASLKKYGFTEDAERIKKKWLATCDYWFEQDKCFYEKYNVVEVKKDVISKTPRRRGFGWTNGAYLCMLLDK